MTLWGDHVVDLFFFVDHCHKMQRYYIFWYMLVFNSMPQANMHILESIANSYQLLYVSITITILCNQGEITIYLKYVSITWILSSFLNWKYVTPSTGGWPVICKPAFQKYSLEHLKLCILFYSLFNFLHPCCFNWELEQHVNWLDVLISMDSVLSTRRLAQFNMAASTSIFLR